MSARRKARPKLSLPNRPQVKRRCAEPPPPVVTDHALVRYLQRVMGIDVDRFRRDLVADGRAKLIETMGEGRVATPDGVVLIVVDGRVVSVLDRNEANSRFGRTAHRRRSGET